MLASCLSQLEHGRAIKRSQKVDDCSHFYLNTTFLHLLLSLLQMCEKLVCKLLAVGCTHVIVVMAPEPGCKFCGRLISNVELAITQHRIEIQ